MFFPFEIIFIVLFLFGSVLSLRRVRWFGFWLGIEINLIGVMPIFCFHKNFGEVESSVNYFLIQRLGSAWVLIGCICCYLNIRIFMLFLVVGCLIKLGAGPFFFWLPKVIENYSWQSCIILTTWQKVVPLILFFFVSKFSVLLVIVGIITAFIGGLGGIGKSALRILIRFSSIINLGWILRLGFISRFYSFIYFFFYRVLRSFIFFIIGLSIKFINYVVEYSLNRFKLIQFLIIIGVAGIPPFLGFFIKLIRVIVIINLWWVVLFLVIRSFFRLYFYLIIRFRVRLKGFNLWYYFLFKYNKVWVIIFWLFNILGWSFIYLFFYYALIFFY